MDGTDIIQRMVDRTRIGHLSIDRIVRRGDSDPLAPRREGDLRAVLLGWSPSLHPMRIPILVPLAAGRGPNVSGYDLSQLEKAIAGQRSRHRAAVSLWGDDPEPALRNLDVPLDQARPMSSHLFMNEEMVGHLVALCGSEDAARRRIEVGVETILRRREAGRHEAHALYMLQDLEYREFIELVPGAKLHYGRILIDPAVIPTSGFAVGRRVGDLLDVPGLSDRIILDVGRFGERLMIRISQLHTPRRTLRDYIGEDDREGRSPGHGQTVGIGPFIDEPAPSPRLTWTAFPPGLTAAMNKAGLTSAEEIAVLDDHELRALTGLDQEGIRALRKHTASRLEELVAMNAGRLVRRA